MRYKTGGWICIMPSLQNPREVPHFQIKVDNPGVFDPYHQRVTATCHSWHRAFVVLHQEQKELDLEARRCQSPTSKTNRSHKYLAHENPGHPSEGKESDVRREDHYCVSLTSNQRFDFNIQLCFKNFQTFQSFLKKNPWFSKRASQATDQKTSTFNHKYIKGLGLIFSKKKNVFFPVEKWKTPKVPCLLGRCFFALERSQVPAFL